MFDECGFEAYEPMGWMEVESGPAEPANHFIGSVLRFNFRELSEPLQRQLYSVKEFLDSDEVLDCEDRQAVIDG